MTSCGVDGMHFSSSRCASNFNIKKEPEVLLHRCNLRTQLAEVNPKPAWAMHWDCLRNKEGEAIGTTVRQCFLNTAGQLCAWTHSSCDSRRGLPKLEPDKVPARKKETAVKFHPWLRSYRQAMAATNWRTGCLQACCSQKATYDPVDGPTPKHTL